MLCRIELGITVQVDAKPGEVNDQMVEQSRFLYFFLVLVLIRPLKTLKLFDKWNEKLWNNDVDYVAQRFHVSETYVMDVLVKCFWILIILKNKLNTTIPWHSICRVTPFRMPILKFLILSSFSLRLAPPPQAHPNQASPQGPSSQC